MRTCQPDAVGCSDVLAPTPPVLEIAIILVVIAAAVVVIAMLARRRSR